MTINERVRTIRKSKEVNLTLEKFGERLGVKRNTMSAIETGRNSVTEQMQKSICREFNVNHTWLATGEGSMFAENDDAFMEKIDRIMSGENDARKNIFKALLDASDEDIAAFERIITEAAKFSKKNEN